jgi:hypothetical protein
VFDRGGTFLGAYATMKAAFTDHMTEGIDIIIFVRDDLTSFTADKTEYNVGKGGGTKIIDLNGKTLNLNKDFFYAQAKNWKKMQIKANMRNIRTSITMHV